MQVRQKARNQPVGHHTELMMERRGTAARAVYANDGWVSFSDWLGTMQMPTEGYRDFAAARAYIRSLGIGIKSNWLTYCRCGTASHSN